jgi:hypothetical protein
MRPYPGRVLRKLLRLSAREWRNLLLAQWELLVTQRIVRTLPTGELTSGRPSVAGAQPSPAGDPARLEEARELALGVSRAARHGLTRPQCLVRAMALSRMMERDGLTGGVIRVGVRRREAAMEAHAWVEYAGEVLGDREDHVGTFAELPHLHVAPRP